VGALIGIFHSPPPTPHPQTQSRILQRHLSSRDRLDVISSQFASNAFGVFARELRHPRNIEMRRKILGQRRLAGALRTDQTDA
jgi:hypothetical protein